MTYERNVRVETTCKRCGVDTVVMMAQGEYEEDMLKDALLNAALCTKCQDAQNTAEHERKLKEKKAAVMFENQRTYEARRKASQLDEYRLFYDPDHPNANPYLFKWFGERVNDNNVVTGKTGLCKSRIMQYYAYEELNKGFSVYYTPAADLLDKLAFAYRNKNAGIRFMNELKKYDLLIIDEFCKFSETQPKIIYMWKLLDRRYVRTDQVKNIAAGKYNPLYTLRNQSNDGWRFWLAMNEDSEIIADKFDNFRTEAGEPIIRRILDSTENNIYKGR